MNNQLTNDTNFQLRCDATSFGVPKGYNMTTHEGPTGGQQAMGQQVHVQPKEFEQPRYYGSPMVVQQSFVGGQMGTGAAYLANQGTVYPGQQQMYDTRLMGSYLLMHPGQDQGQAAASFYGATRRGAEPVVYEGFVARLQQLLPVPPMAQAARRPEINMQLNQRRARRKSKFTKKQDDVIVELKRRGKSWVEIAEMSGVGSYLAARNRYQVIVGQQGNNNSSSWGDDDKSLLQRLLDEAEMGKWKFIALELSKATGKSFTDNECRETVRMLFWADPASLGVSEETVNECVKEKKTSERANEQQLYIDNDRQYAQPFLAPPSAAANHHSSNPDAAINSSHHLPALQLYHSYNSKSTPESVDTYYY